ncbi:MAG: AI-2E family transporter [Lachnospiraceae bacterium]|nr:AI-2E family transporter [Lachnospiraceae bacterium]
MKKFKELLEKNWFAYTFAACVGVVLFVLLTHMQGIGSFFSAFKSVISPVICGAVMAYLMNPLCNHFERKIFDKIKREKLRHSLSVITTVLLVVIAIVLLLVALVPSLIKSISLLVSNVPQYMENLEANIDRMSLSLARYGIDAAGIEKAIEKALSDLLADIPENMGTILSTSVTVGSSLFNLVIGFILAVYFLSDKESFRMGLKRFRHAILTDKAYAAHSSFWKKCHEILIRYIGFDVLDGIIVGVVNALFMVIVKMPYISLISVLVGVTNLIPTFGPFIGAGIGAFILVLVDPMQALIFLIFTLVLQLIDGYILKPKLFGGSLGVSAAWILVSIVVGGKLFGVAGIVLAIPFAAIISFIYDELAMPLLLKRKAKNEKEEELQSEKEK